MNLVNMSSKNRSCFFSQYSKTFKTNFPVKCTFRSFILNRVPWSSLHLCWHSTATGLRLDASCEHFSVTFVRRCCKHKQHIQHYFHSSQQNKIPATTLSH